MDRVVVILFRLALDPYAISFGLIWEITSPGLDSKSGRKESAMMRKPIPAISEQKHSVIKSRPCENFFVRWR